MKRTSGPAIRRGFTLIELLIVIAILGILASLTAGALMRYKAVQQKLNTDLTLAKLDRILHNQWEAVISQAQKEAIPDEVMSAAGNDGRLARVMYIKLRLQQEFPMSYKEVNSGNPSFPSIKPKGSYQQTLSVGPPPSMPDLHPVQKPAANFNIESSICLYMALSVDRGGSGTNLDMILSSREIGTEPRSKLKFFTDDYGRPLAFYRWPADADDLLKNVPPTDPMIGRDREDPDGLLMSKGGKFYGQIGTKAPNSRGLPPEPMIVSAGLDGKFGLDSLDNGAPPQTMRTSNQKLASDNPNNYRVRVFGRGD